MQRTKFMQQVMILTQVASMTEAVLRGFDGSHERAIALFLERAVEAGNSEAEVILQAAGGDYLKAAYLITSSKIPENVNIY